MSRPILADTGPLYALADPSDQYHIRARQELARLEAEGYFVAVAYPTIAESYTLVLRRLGAAFAVSWLLELQEGVMALNPEPGDYTAAVSTVAGMPDQLITIFDAVTAVLSRRLKLPVWTFDRDFDLLHVKRWN
jgi:predicted nucleic acid-binding protein